MTRIIAGRAGGRRLRVPAGRATRPTSDRVREALFSRLEHLLDLEGAAVLDLFAGSGALGLEAASRGARPVVLVESAPPALAAARANAAALDLPGVEVRAGAVLTALSGAPGAHDVVLLDPPYDLPEADLGAVLDRLGDGWLTDRALVVVERASRSPEPAWPAPRPGSVGLVRRDQRRYGETVLWFAEPPLA